MAEAVFSPALANFRDILDGILNKAKRTAVQHHDFSTIYLVLDALDNLLQYVYDSPEKDRWNDALKNAGKRASDIHLAIADLALVALRVFPDFLEDIRQSASKSSYLPEDGTVHELTSNALTWLKRLCDYVLCVESLLILVQANEKAWSWTECTSTPADELRLKLCVTRRQVQDSQSASSPSSASNSVESSAESLNSTRSQLNAASHTKPSLTFSYTATKHYYADAITALLANLELKAKSYKKTTSALPSSTSDKSGKQQPLSVLATLFLVNNYHYIVKTFRSQAVLWKTVGKDVEMQIETRMREELDVYLQSWQPLLAILAVRFQVLTLQKKNFAITINFEFTMQFCYFLERIYNQGILT